MNMVFVLDDEKKPMSMCRPARARQLLKEGKAAVFRKYPFTIILKAFMPDAVVKEVICKLDPGSKTTGIALVSDNRVVFAAELEHRGQAIKNSLQSRFALRRGRRNRKTRYREARFNNRVRKAGVGDSGSVVKVNPEMKPLLIKCTGHGHRQMCATDKYGFPKQHRTTTKMHFGFQTGDIVKTVVLKGKHTGIHKGRVMCRAKGSFDIKTEKGRVNVWHKNCIVLHKIDGYNYV